MIEVTWDGRVLEVRSHATSDTRVCAAMSGLAGTLYTGYGSPEPTDGMLQWDSSPFIGSDISEFVLNFIRTLERQYPDQLQLKEVRQSAA